MVSWFQCVARALRYIRITQERHVCEYMFLHKNDPLSMVCHPYRFVGEVLLHPVYWVLIFCEFCLTFELLS